MTVVVIDKDGNIVGRIEKAEEFNLISSAARQVLMDELVPLIMNSREYKRKEWS